MEEPIDEIPDVGSPGCLRNLDFRMVLPKPCPRLPVTGLVDSGQKTSEGHATHGVADQTPVELQTSSCPNDKNANSLLNPGTSINAIGLLEIENKIQLVGREMKCKNNRWKESRRKKRAAIRIHRRMTEGNPPGEVLARRLT